MAKAKPQAKKAKPGSSDKKKSEGLGLVKKTSTKVASAAAKLVKAASGAIKKPGPAVKEAPPSKKPAGVKAAPPPAPPTPAPAPAAKKAKAAVAAESPAPPSAPTTKASKAAGSTKAAEGKGAGMTSGKASAKAAAKAEAAAPASASAERPRPRATKLPPVGELLNKRDMEQVLTVGVGRGVTGEGGLKGRLAVKDGFPYLMVIGRDKRELSFLLQGPDQEVLPAYVDHKVSVSGLIRKTHNQGGTVDVRKYSAKKVEAEVVPVETEQKLRFLSPGELEQMCAAGMGAGMKGFGSVRGNLEMTGEDFFLVVSGGGTRQQVSFLLGGKVQKSMRKLLGQTLLVHGVMDKSTGWGGRIEVENYEVRAPEHHVSRDGLDVVALEGPKPEKETVEVKMNHGLSVRMPEKPGYTWAIEPTTAKRVGLREAIFEPAEEGPGTREFFFTPRNPGTFDIEFFLVKAFSPAQVDQTFALGLQVKAA